MRATATSLIRIVASAVVTVVLTAGAARGQNAAWVNPSGGSYDVAGNWVPGVVPRASNNILINVGTAYNIGFQADRDAAGLSISNNLELTFSADGTGVAARTFSLTGSAVIDRAELTLGDLSQGGLLNMQVGGKLDMRGGRLDLLNGAQLTSQTSLTNSNSIEGAGGVDSTIMVRG
ncbi:MAG: hypothetical protein KDA61_08495, partial [Planctomycetales bacterium]|nr:hypothetical protein [Planctomycetales bacterium]